MLKGWTEGGRDGTHTSEIERERDRDRGRSEELGIEKETEIYRQKKEHFFTRTKYFGLLR